MTADAVGELLAAQAAFFTNAPQGGRVEMQGGHGSSSKGNVRASINAGVAPIRSTLAGRHVAARS